MIGQHLLLSKIDKLAAYQSLPRFIILCGPKHSGKHLIAKHIAKKLNATLVDSGIKVDEIRETISLAYKQSQPTVYLLADADKMSPAAKNAILKVTEEPPRKAYFIMTLVDLNNTLATLRSRGTVLTMDIYTPDQILEYATTKGYNFTEDERQTVMGLCTTPGEVDKLASYNVAEFYQFVETVADNIGKVNGANAFKIGSRLSYKEEDEGYDATLFLRALASVYLNGVQSSPLRTVLSIQAISKYLAEMNITGINKSATMDMLILELRGIWMPQ